MFSCLCLFYECVLEKLHFLGILFNKASQRHYCAWISDRRYDGIWCAGIGSGWQRYNMAEGLVYPSSLPEFRLLDLCGWCRIGASLVLTDMIDAFFFCFLRRLCLDLRTCSHSLLKKFVLICE
jgi:hypothetical protein